MADVYGGYVDPEGGQEPQSSVTATVAISMDPTATVCARQNVGSKGGVDNECYAGYISPDTLTLTPWSIILRRKRQIQGSDINPEIEKFKEKSPICVLCGHPKFHGKSVLSTHDFMGVSMTSYAYNGLQPTPSKIAVAVAGVVPFINVTDAPIYHGQLLTIGADFESNPGRRLFNPSDGTPIVRAMGPNLIYKPYFIPIDEREIAITDSGISLASLYKKMIDNYKEKTGDSTSTKDKEEAVAVFDIFTAGYKNYATARAVAVAVGDTQPFKKGCVKLL